MELKKTRVVEHVEHGRNMRSTINYGFWHPGRDSQQAPHFTLTVDTYERCRNGMLRESSFGCQHDLAAKLAPDLAPLIRWHLCDDDGQPMHYVANAVWWAQCSTETALVFGSVNMRKPYDPDPIATFRSTVIFGAIEGEAMPDFAVDDPVLVDSHGLPVMCDKGTIGYARANGPIIAARVTAWCKARLPALRAAFDADMERFEMLSLRDNMRRMLSVATS